MMKRMLFLSGLPRAGSTLLSAILRQNLAIHADMSSPLVNMVSMVQRSLSRAQEFSATVDNATRVRVLCGLFGSYYAPQAGKIVFDTNRVWTAKLELLLNSFPIPGSFAACGRSAKSCRASSASSSRTSSN